MIRRCSHKEIKRIFEIINDAAVAYKGIIPQEYWKVPYMSMDELEHEFEAGIELFGYEENGKLVGVMGMQHKQGVTLIRHAYVCTSRQKRGIGGKLLSHLQKLAKGPVLIATWSNDANAIRFYEKHGFRLISKEDGFELQRKYWSTPEPKIKASVVLADEKWFDEFKGTV